MQNRLRVGLTMREVNASGYDEPRDALARAWGTFLQSTMPEVVWLPIPNLGPALAVRFCDRWGLNGLILTGGEDIGVSLQRDATERSLWQHFMRNERPILGVCRGLQLMWTGLGGDLENRTGHVAVRHRVHYFPETPFDIADGSGEVNSFHALSLREPAHAMRAPIAVFARAVDGSAEGVRFGNGRMAGVMWHPEREDSANPADMSLIRSLFGLERTPVE